MIIFYCEFWQVFGHVSGTMHMAHDMYEIEFCGEECGERHVIMKMNMENINKEEQSQVIPFKAMLLPRNMVYTCVKNQLLYINAFF